MERGIGPLGPPWTTAAKGVNQAFSDQIGRGRDNLRVCLGSQSCRGENRGCSRDKHWSLAQAAPWVDLRKFMDLKIYSTVHIYFVTVLKLVPRSFILVHKQRIKQHMKHFTHTSDTYVACQVTTKEPHAVQTKDYLHPLEVSCGPSLTVFSPTRNTVPVVRTRFRENMAILLLSTLNMSNNQNMLHHTFFIIFVTYQWEFPSKTLT